MCVCACVPAHVCTITNGKGSLMQQNVSTPRSLQQVTALEELTIWRQDRKKTHKVVKDEPEFSKQ